MCHNTLLFQKGSDKIGRMPDADLTDPRPSRPLGESRHRILEILRTAPSPLGAQDIAEQTGQHPNTARFHLDGLVEAGLAARDTEERDQPGRPRVVYRAVATENGAGLRSYRMLARMLTSMVVDRLPHPEVAAVEAGEQWGRFLADRPTPLERIDTAEGIRRMLEVLDSFGFEPAEEAAKPSAAKGSGKKSSSARRTAWTVPAPARTVPASARRAPAVPDSSVIHLTHCPFKEITEEHREVTCSLHLGLMRGVLDEVRAPVTVHRLEPFVEPSLCLARLVPKNNHGAGPAGKR